jgi:Domain of unknown function (DUF1844)
MSSPTTNSDSPMQASFSLLVMSIASSASISMGLTPNPHSGETEKDLNLARFNIDLLTILQEKSKNNLTEDERHLLDGVVSDLQLRFLSTQK